MPLIIVFLRNYLICLPILSLCPLSEVVWLDSVVGAGSFLIKFSSFPQHSSRFLLAVYKSCIRFSCPWFWIRRSPIRSRWLSRTSSILETAFFNATISSNKIVISTFPLSARHVTIVETKKKKQTPVIVRLNKCIVSEQIK